MTEVTPHEEISNIHPKPNDIDILTETQPQEPQDLTHTNALLNLDIAQLRLTNYNLTSQSKALEKKYKALELREGHYREKNRLLVDNNEAFEVRLERLKGENGLLRGKNEGWKGRVGGFGGED